MHAVHTFFRSLHRVLPSPFIPLSNRISLRSGLALLLAAVVAGCSGVRQVEDGEGADYSILVFSKTDGFRHDSIEDGIAALERLGRDEGFAVTATEDASAFSRGNLSGYDAVVFLNTTGDIFNESQEEAFEQYIRGGGGFVGVHAAADTEYGWEWYGGLVGAYFDSHSEVQEADVHVLDPAHPATRSLPPRWTRADEWYNYKANPRGSVHVMATLGEKSYEGGTMGHDHPIVWAHLYDGGRSFYTGLGHTPETYTEPFFLEHVLGGIRWAAGVEEGDVAATIAGSFEKVVLDDETTFPMELEVAPDGRVFWIERDGAFKIWDPANESTHMAAYIDVTTKIEDGLLGIALDPDFEENNWVYLYYTPISEDPNRLSRFTMDGNRLDLSSEIVILEVPMQREKCCHSAGGLTFGPDGNLWLSTGDNTGGSAPRTDERPGREYFDAQRTTANTKDLRGKVLRIRPQDDGSYTIPEGNLFEDDDPRTRPEIYTMGHRNPWRITVDPKTGWLYWGDVGPGNQYEEDRKPLGVEEFGQAKAPGFFGWPYFVGPNAGYRDYNYATEEYGEWPDPEAPINESPNNTGLRKLPPPQPAWIWYSYGPSEEFPEMGVGGMSAGAGPVYHYDAATVGPHGLPPYFDKKVFIFEWMRNWIQEVTLDEEGNPMEITPFTPEYPYIRPIDMELGPDGRVYVLEWGTEFWGQNRNGRLVRMDYYGSEDRPPAVAVTAEPSSGRAPLAVSFRGSASRNENGEAPLDYAWDVDADGTIDARTADFSHTYEEAGTYTVRLTVTDHKGLSSTEEMTVTAGNTAPEVSIVWPPNGGFIEFNEPVPYEVEVTDREDGAVASPGPGVTVRPFLGHDTHTHPLLEHRGREGTFVVVPDFTHKPYIIDHFVEVEATYTDRGAPGTGSLSGTDRILLRPRLVQAENYTGAENVELAVTANRQWPTFAEVTEVFIDVDSDGYVWFEPVNLHGIDMLSLRLVPESTGSVEVRVGALDGPLLAEADFEPSSEEPIDRDRERPELTEEEEQDEAARVESPVKITGWTNIRMPIADPGGEHALYFIFRGAEKGTVVKFDEINFEGPAVMARPGHELSSTY